MARLVRVEVLQQLHTELYAIAPSDSARLMFPLARGLDRPIDAPLTSESQQPQEPTKGAPE